MDLAQFVIDQIAPERWHTFLMAEGKSRFVWYQRAIAGIGVSAQLWADILSRLTTVQHLERLTLYPLQSVITTKGTMSAQERWCPHCLHDDFKQNKTPYFRLSWDVGINKICREHHTELIGHCPHCNEKNVRHSASYVIPGWCTACKCFLGVEAPNTPPDSNEMEIARTREIEGLIAQLSGPKCSPDLEGLHTAIEVLIKTLDNDVGAHFAKRIGVQKSSVHYWKNRRSQLTLEALIQISTCCNVALSDFIRGDLSAWAVPDNTAVPHKKMKSRLSFARTGTNSTHDWELVRSRLRQELSNPDNPKSVTEMARILKVNKRSLYVQAHEEAQLLGQRYVQHLRNRGKTNRAASREALTTACKYVRDQGYGISARLIRPIVDEDVINKTWNLYFTLSQIAREIA